MPRAPRRPIPHRRHPPIPSLPLSKSRPRRRPRIDAAFAKARAEGKPVFLYWGAVWCPPCNQVKATIFNRQDFIDRSRFFVPVYLDGDRISETFRTDPEQLFRYNMDDVRETLALFRLLGYPWFLQTRIFPYSFQNCPLRGNATRINTLFLREYLHRGHAIPARTGSKY